MGGGEVEREEDRVGEVVRLWTLGVVQRSLIVDPCFWGSAFGKAPVVGHGMGRGMGFSGFFGEVGVEAQNESPKEEELKIY